MLAEKRIDEPLKPSKVIPQVKDSLSTIPPQIIQTAKALDVDLKKSAISHKTGSDNDSNGFDDDLPEDFDPEDMDEDAIAKMMEEEEFAQQQLKLAGETIRNRKQKETIVVEPVKKEEKLSIETSSSVIMQPNLPSSLVSPLPFTQSLAIPDIPPSMYTAQLQTVNSKISTTPKKRGRKKDETPTIIDIPKTSRSLAEQFIPKELPLPTISTIQHTSILPTKPNTTLNIPSVLHAPQLFTSSTIQHTSSVIAHSSVIQQQRTLPPMSQSVPSSILGITNQEPIIPSTVLDVQNTRLLDPSELGKPPDNLLESPTKKRGRRKKITPLRESLHSSPPPNVTITPNVSLQIPTTMPNVAKPITSILSERLTGNPGKKKFYILIVAQISLFC